MRSGLLKKVCCCLALLLLLPASAVFADEGVDYLRQIKPILAARWFACHGALKQESGLRLDTGALIRKGGDSGSVVVAGNAKNSSLLQRVSATDESERMPTLGKPLTPEQIDLIKRWIEQGATSPADEQPEEDPQKHWAFQKPVRPAVPKINNSAWVDNPVDAFIAAEHERRNLKPNSPAAKHVLLRRLSLDLIGLPPTRKEYHAFLADDSPKAYEKLVNRLLNSPQYGERWGRHWMDVWRYSDWYGRRTVNDVRNSYPHIWRWRDWIINSLNEDKGYDRMIMEMLAADEIAPEDDDVIVATGFIVRNWFSLNYDQWMKDLVEHTGKAFLGIRMNCAHCHDHKYDPISQKEYFRFLAIFNNTEDADKGDERPTLVTMTAKQIQQKTKLQATIADLKKSLVEKSKTSELAADQKRLDALKKQLAGIKGIPTPIMRELPADKRRKTLIQIRGNFLVTGEEVTPGVPAAFHRLPANVEVNRLSLARWLVDFPSYRDGREVLLCWVRGEETIGFWHETNAVFNSRQPL